MKLKKNVLSIKVWKIFQFGIKMMYLAMSCRIRLEKASEKKQHKLNGIHRNVIS